MSEIDSVSVFLDEGLVDDLWTLIKREGLEYDTAKEVATKVGTTAKFGVGKLWSWMAADLKAELSGGLSGKVSHKLEITSTFRAMLLPGMIDDTITIDDTTESLDEIIPGRFVDVSANTLELIPLPTLASFIRQLLISAVGDAEDQKDQEKNINDLLAYTNTFTASDRAMTFLMRVDPRYAENFRNPPLAQRFFNESEEDVFNALCMSRDDLVLALLEVPRKETPLFLISVLEERFLKRNLAIFTLNRPVRVFGRVTEFREHDSLGVVVGVQPIMISLTR